MSIPDWLKSLKVVEILSVNISRSARPFCSCTLTISTGFSGKALVARLLNTLPSKPSIPGDSARKSSCSLSDDSSKTLRKMLRIAAILSLRLTFLLLLCSNFSVECQEHSPSTKEQLKIEKLPPCEACEVLIESFKKGIERTKRGKFEGGDSAWEEDKLKSYSKSEVRLTEIQENLCKEVERGQTQCHHLAEEFEHDIEAWWFKHQEAYPDIYIYLCVEKQKLCCPTDHFGPNCKQCAGFPDKVCSNNGECKGSGTRKGNGRCLCDKGYTGVSCEACSAGYYESYRDENKFLCSPCHDACEGACKGAGPADCSESCKRGWRMMGEKGCVDINECLRSDKYCPGNQFCVNAAGKYSCLRCDRACRGCSGDGPDMCIECADGYDLEDNMCINLDVLGKRLTENWGRYFTYFGLCLATCIIVYQHNIYIASTIGIFVGVYISTSEYMIATSDIQSATPSIDLFGPAE